MSEAVFKALKSLYIAAGTLSDFVFCNTQSEPVDHNNITKRVWYPLLAKLGLEKRRPYQTRHTTATLWLAAGESAEWIAKKWDMLVQKCFLKCIQGLYLISREKIEVLLKSYYKTTLILAMLRSWVYEKKAVSVNSTNDLNSSIADLLSLEQGKEFRRKQVSLITSYLVGRFSITPNDTQLVIALSNEVKNNNFDALFIWVDSHFDEIGYGSFQTWDSFLEKFLSDIY